MGGMEPSEAAGAVHRKDGGRNGKRRGEAELLHAADVK